MHLDEINHSVDNLFFDFYRMPTPKPIVPKTKSRGRIRISQKNDSAVSYLSRNPGGCGLEVITSVANALEVEYNPSVTDPQVLHIPDVSLIYFRRLGWPTKHGSGANAQVWCSWGAMELWRNREDE